MKYLTYLPLTAVILVTLSAGTMRPPDKTSLALARNENEAANNNPQTVSFAARELKTADAAMRRANLAEAENEPMITINHLANLARKLSAIAQEVGWQKAAELNMSDVDTGPRADLTDR